MPGGSLDASEASLSEAVQEIAAVSDPSPAEEVPEITGRERRIRFFELCLVLLVAFGEYFFSSIHTLVTDHGTKFSQHFQSAVWLESVIRESGCLLLLGYVLWRRKLGYRSLGLRWSVRDLGTGLAIAIVSYLAYGLAHPVLSGIYHALFSVSAGGVTAKQLYSHVPWVAFPFAILNGFFEELTVRAYLMTEIRELTGSWKLAVAVSVVVQTSYHLYYGWIGALSASFMFLVLSLYYARTQKATPLVFAHALIDIYGFIRLM